VAGIPALQLADFWADMRSRWRFRRQSGSHARYVHPDGLGVTVSLHPGDVPVGGVRSES